MFKVLDVLYSNELVFWSCPQCMCKMVEVEPQRSVRNSGTGSCKRRCEETYLQSAVHRKYKLSLKVCDNKTREIKLLTIFGKSLETVIGCAADQYYRFKTDHLDFKNSGQQIKSYLHKSLLGEDVSVQVTNQQNGSTGHPTIGGHGLVIDKFDPKHSLIQQLRKSMALPLITDKTEFSPRYNVSSSATGLSSNTDGRVANSTTSGSPLANHSEANFVTRSFNNTPACGLRANSVSRGNSTAEELKNSNGIFRSSQSGTCMCKFDSSASTHSTGNCDSGTRTHTTGNCDSGTSTHTTGNCDSGTRTHTTGNCDSGTRTHTTGNCDSGTRTHTTGSCDSGTRTLTTGNCDSATRTAVYCFAETNTTDASPHISVSVDKTVIKNSTPVNYCANSSVLVELSEVGSTAPPPNDSSFTSANSSSSTAVRDYTKYAAISGSLPVNELVGQESVYKTELPSISDNVTQGECTDNTAHTSCVSSNVMLNAEESWHESLLAEFEQSLVIDDVESTSGRSSCQRHAEKRTRDFNQLSSTPSAPLKSKARFGMTPSNGLHPRSNDTLFSPFSLPAGFLSPLRTDIFNSTMNEAACSQPQTSCKPLLPALGGADPSRDLFLDSDSSDSETL